MTYITLDYAGLDSWTLNYLGSGNLELGITSFYTFCAFKLQSGEKPRTPQCLSSSKMYNVIDLTK